MRVARERIDLKELGIQSLRPKRAATGAIVLEVPGPNGAEKAETLRERMAAALQDMEGVKVARPTKQGEARIKDILESTSIQEVRKAFSSAGSCKEDELQTGEIRVAPNGMGTLWVRGPLAAINRVVAAGRIELGWTTSSPGSCSAINAWKGGTCRACARVPQIAATCATGAARRGTKPSPAITHCGA